MKPEINIVGQADIAKCPFGGHALEYLYRELDDEAYARFEAHLPACAACTDDLAELAYPRFEVFEWKRENFDPIPTPLFDLTFTKTSKRASWLSIESVFGGLRTSLSLRLVGFPIAAALILALMWQVTPILDLIATPAPEISAVLPSAEAEREKEQRTDLATSVADNALNEDEVDGRAIASAPVVERRRTDITVQTTSRKSSGVKVLRKMNPPIEAATADLGITLPGRSEPRDDSLRLTDIFDDVGGV